MLGCRRDVWTDLQKILRVRRIPELSEREGGEAGPAGWNSGSGEEGSYGEVKRYATRCDYRVPLKGGGNCVIGNLTAESRITDYTNYRVSSIKKISWSNLFDSDNT